MSKHLTLAEAQQYFQEKCKRHSHPGFFSDVKWEVYNGVPHMISKTVKLHFKKCERTGVITDQIGLVH